MPIIKRRKTKRIVYFLYLKHIIRYQDKLVINSQVTEHVFIFESYDVGVKRSFAPYDTGLFRTACSHNPQNIHNSLIFLRKMATYSCFGGSQGQKSSCKQACIGFPTF